MNIGISTQDHERVCRTLWENDSKHPGLANKYAQAFLAVLEPGTKVARRADLDDGDLTDHNHVYTISEAFLRWPGHGDLKVQYSITFDGQRHDLVDEREVARVRRTAGNTWIAARPVNRTPVR